jgi:GTP-binding protein
VIRPLVAIVGRPNVGKSTLFNKLVGGRLALVEDVPGVTRDRHYGDGDWDGRLLSYVDTGGFVPSGEAGAIEPGREGDDAKKAKAVGGGPGGKLPSVMDDAALLASMRAQAQLAVEEAQAIVLVCDATEGLVPSDVEVGRLLRKSGKPVFVAVNKVDSDRRAAELPVADFYELGFDQVHSISAEHGRGLGDLLDEIVGVLPNAPRIDAEEPERPEDGKIRLAVVGRPNVGKSTLLNAVLGRTRFIASPVPGTTHDAVDEEFTYKGRTFILTDTAGIRRRKSISAKVEGFSVVRAITALEEADVAAVLMDPSELGVEQDARIVGIAEEKGRAMVLVVNKWDLVEGDEKAEEKAKTELADRIDFVPYAPVVFASALTKARVNKVLDLAIRLYDQSTARIPTPQLNEWLQDVQDSQPAPLWRGFPVKFYYAVQVGTRPLTISIQTNRPQAINDASRRFMTNKLRERFELEVPVRFAFKQKTGDRRRPAKKNDE